MSIARAARIGFYVRPSRSGPAMLNPRSDDHMKDAACLSKY